MASESAAANDKKRRAKLSIPAAAIKRVMQADDDVGRIAQSTPAAVCRAVELFVADLVAAAVAEMGDETTTLQPTHVAAAIKNNAKFDFLEGTAADLPAAAAAAADGDANDAEANAETDEQDADNRT